MSNISLIIEERASNIGNFLVGRLLPFRQKRMIGPFIFIDHMGPASLSENETLDVAPHPHIGLSTLTYLFEGEILHRDSLSNELIIKPGEINWMTAGKGVVHSERTPKHLYGKNKKLHGLQIWIALPDEIEDCEPSFNHFDADSVPNWNEGNLHYKLIAGSFDGKQSPVPVYSDLYMIEIKNNSDKDETIDIGDKLYGEAGLYILNGNISVEENTFEEKQILVNTNPNLCKFTLSVGSTVYIFGGKPFSKDKEIYWNFVSSSKEKIEVAKQMWKEQKFEKVINETEFVPLP